MEVILGIQTIPSIIISAVIAVLYTLMGGLVSVAYTDVFQIIFIGIGLVSFYSLKFVYSGLTSDFLFGLQFLSLPFAITNEHVNSIRFDTTDWRGDLPTHLVGEWVDFALLLLLGK